MTIIITALLLALLRAVIKVSLDIGFEADNWYFTLTDLTFVIISGLWFFRLFKGSTWFKAFYIGVLSFSIFFSFQQGFGILLYFLPFIAVFYKYRGYYEGRGFKELFTGLLKIIIYPIFLFIKLLERLSFELKSKKTSAIPSYSLYVLVGVIVGGVVLVALYNLDPEFKEWLENIQVIIDTIRFTFGVFIAYILAFIWYFYGPVVVEFSVNEESNFNIDTVLKIASLIVTAIIVGYVLYDAYIVLRMLRVLSLVFESMGKNTQMYFLEMVILGGIFTYLVSLLLDKINGDSSENSHKKVLRNLLVFAIFFLLPPMINVLRALTLVYIPEFGLTVRRLFGIYVTVSLFAAFIFIVFKAIQGQSKIFLNSILVFLVVLYGLSFYVPNSLLIFNWHFNRYMQNEVVDFPYMTRLNVYKWGFLYKDKLQDTNYSKDALLLWKFESGMQNSAAAREYRDKFMTLVSGDVQSFVRDLENQNFQDIYTKYLNKDNMILLVFDPVSQLKINVSSYARDSAVRPNKDGDVFYKDYFGSYSKYYYSNLIVNAQEPKITVAMVYQDGATPYIKSFSYNLDIAVTTGTRDSGVVRAPELKPLWVSGYGNNISNIVKSDIVSKLCQKDRTGTSSWSNSSTCISQMSSLVSQTNIPPIPESAVKYYFVGDSLYKPYNDSININVSPSYSTGSSNNIILPTPTIYPSPIEIEDIRRY